MLESGWFSPTPRELSAVEQFETALLDSSLFEEALQYRLETIWMDLEKAHGSRVYSMVSPEGMVIDSPLVYDEESRTSPGRRK